MTSLALLQFLVLSCVLIFCVEADVIANYPGGLQKTYNSVEASFGRGISKNGVTGILHVVNPIEACISLPKINESVSAIALIQRGDCHFDLKVYHAQEAGYMAVIIFDDVQEGLFSMDGERDDVQIPSVLVSKDDGTSLASTPNILIQLTQDAFLQWPSFLVTFIIVVSCTIFMFSVFMFFRVRNRRTAQRASLMSRSQIRDLPTHKFDGKSEATCCICLADFEQGDTIRSLPCKHEFHKSCIDPWLQDRKRSCPLCKRDPLNMSDTTPLLQQSINTETAST